MDKANIHEIVLTDGSTRIPKIQQLLQDFFNRKELTRSINPDDGVVYGAAVQAAIVNDDKSEEIKDLLISDVTPSSLVSKIKNGYSINSFFFEGIDTAGGTMSVVIKRNTKIPIKQTQTFTTISSDQSSFDIRTFEGQRLTTKDNHLLESFELSDISLVPHGEIEMEVIFDLNANSILNVTLTENEEFAYKLREFETIWSLIMMKIYPTEDSAGTILEELSNDITEDKSFPPTTFSSGSNNEVSNLILRVFDIRNEHHHILLPIERYENKPLLPLEEAIEHLEEIIPKIRRNASIAKARSIDVADGLTQDESAAIQLYTMKCHPNDHSLYMHINALLREKNRDKIIPYFCYLKLVLTTLWQLPSVKAIVWRGIKEGLSAQYPIGKEFVWWGWVCVGMGVAVDLLFI
ncbi:unnamed protein product [Rotaria sp. Silwood1]|nr:unnamed protein product [Rotaria sp. Silwood1]